MIIDNLVQCKSTGLQVYSYIARSYFLQIDSFIFGGPAVFTVGQIS